MTRLVQVILLVLCLLALASRTASVSLGRNSGQAADRKESTSQAPAAGHGKVWEAAAVPAPVYTFGQQLEGAAAPDLKHWLWGHVKKHMRGHPIDPKVTISAVDERFAAASDLARDAGIYLAYYFAYKDDDENQRMLSYRIRDIDREAYEIGRQLQVLADTQNLPARGGLVKAASIEERVAREKKEQELNARLRELRDEREMKGSEMAASRKKVNIYLKLMAAAHEKMQGTDPAVLHELK